ncbi:MAG: MCP four helix bundle domain-containing protein [Burkholderiales bacterium]|nr:MCP four helix bundle domain-containing protein [Burkholderiales bacterium]
MNIAAWSVRARLMTGFGLVCALMLVIIGVGLASMARIEAGLNYVVDSRVPALTATKNLLSQTDAVAIALRNMMLNENADDRKKQLDTVTKAFEQTNDALAVLDRLVVLPKGKEVLQQIKEAGAKYREGQKNLSDLIMEGKADESRTFLTAQLRPVLATYKDAIGALATRQNELMKEAEATAEATYSGARATMLGLGVLALALAAAVGAFIARSLLQELGGEPKTAADIARAVAQGDFTRTVHVKVGDTNSLMASLGTMQGNLAQVVATVRQGSESVATASAEIAQGNNDLSSRTEQQASALEETASSMEELSATVKQNADSARQANQLALSASSVAVQGGVVVNQVVDTMKGINEASRKIADIISVIDGIAFQTNILALNAAVEAARAGEQGRGFAVVASEVRSLAGRSAEAAKEIKTLIDTSVERVSHGSALVDQAGSTMTEVVDSIKRVTDIMGEISAASNEQSQGVAQVGEAVSQMDQTTQQNAALVEEMAAAASSLRGQAQDLVQSVAFFQLGSTVAQPARTQVRSSVPPAIPFAGAERRNAGPAASAPHTASGAARAATSPAAAAKAAAPRPAAPKPAAATPAPAAKAPPKAAPAGGDDGWETF